MKIIKEYEQNGFKNTCFFFTGLSVLLLVSAILVNVLLPSEVPSDVVASESADEEFAMDDDEFKEAEDPVFVTLLEDYAFTGLNEVDEGLLLYREPVSRAAVQWFYIHVTGNKDVALAILEAADKNDIPLSLAFALAHTESRFNVNAVNKNSNSSIDRGLFQLNSGSFPGLSEADFFNPVISAKYGLSHLKFCLDTAGNEISALAMYNAGTTKVRSNKTPQSTLNYVSKILQYQDMLNRLFKDEVVTFFEPTVPAGGISVAMRASF